jgi:hypothetical protein
MNTRTLSTLLAIGLTSTILCACGDNESQKILGKWLDMRTGKSVDFSEKQMKASDGIQVVDSYKIDGDKVTVYMTRGGSKVGTEYALSEDGKKACTGTALDTCLVRPDRAGKLEGMWGLDENNSKAMGNFEVTPVYMMTGLGPFRIENMKFEGSKVTLNLREDRALIQEPATRSMPPMTYTFNGDDVLCFAKKPDAPATAPEPKCLARIKKKS